ncbi:MAG TPA: efflux RND transporter periplasmic adaptor subunit [Opitutaceae bacterium]|jgi:RND family efflux transporter MFP subunit|nr:efflux RND transporter periplasmic adaptor subunit [Opitutaceae bacterium]
MPNKPFFSRARLIVAVSVLSALVAGLIYFTRPVAKVVRVVRGQAVKAVPGSVMVDAEYEMELKSELGGRIIKSALDEGKHVKEGEFLAQLDTGGIEIQIEKLQIDEDMLKKRIAVGSPAQLSLDGAKVGFADAERLHKLGQMSDSDFESQQRGFESVQWQVKLEQISNQNLIDVDENALKAMRRDRDKMTITAPFDGVVSKVLARPGALIDAATPIAVLISTNRTVVARISEEDFAGIRVGQRASVRFLGYSDELHRASVSKILPTADPDTQRYEVFLNVDLPLELLIPGLTGEVSIVVGEHENTLIVPRRALSGYNLLVVKNGRVRLRKVSIGYVGLNEIEILDGVGEGERVIVEDTDLFRDGDHVRSTILPQ